MATYSRAVRAPIFLPSASGSPLTPDLWQLLRYRPRYRYRFRARDVIIDFEQGEDVIDLSAALRFSRRALTVDQEFRFVGTDAFSGTPDQPGPPELRYEMRGDFTIIQMDADGLSRFFGDGR